MDLIIFHNRFTNRTVTGTQTLSSPGVTEWICMSGQIGVQITGQATSITAVVERSSLDPLSSDGANPTPADGVTLTGDPSSGLIPTGYYEPGTAWWRVRVSSLSGGVVTISLSGHSSSYL
jgi:hypothetical protein